MKWFSENNLIIGAIVIFLCVAVIFVSFHTKYQNWYAYNEVDDTTGIVTVTIKNPTDQQLRVVGAQNGCGCIQTLSDIPQKLKAHSFVILYFSITKGGNAGITLFVSNNVVTDSQTLTVRRSR